MILFRNLFPFHGKPALARAFIFCVLIAATPHLAAAQQTQAQPAVAPCNFTVFKRPLPLYQNLKGVNVYIDFPRGLQEAIECRGYEENCAKHSGTISGTHGIAPDEIARYINAKTSSLKSLNSNFPEVLYQDNLANVLRTVAKKELAPVLPHDSSCQVPEPTMLNPRLGYTHNTPPTGASPDVLYLTIHVTLVTTTQPHIVILTFVTDRHGDANYYHSNPASTAIPLNLSSDDLNKTFADFVIGLGRSIEPGEYGSE